MMKKLVPIVMIAAMLITMMPSCSFAADTSFSDISGHWAEKTINKWKSQGIIAGYPDGTFQPDQYVTRAELAKIVALAFDLKEKGPLTEYFDPRYYPWVNDPGLDYPNREYADLDSSAWYYPYVECAAQYIPIYPLPVNYKTNLPYQENVEKGPKGFLPEVDALRIHFAETLVKIKIEQENLNIEMPPFGEIRESVKASFKDNEYQNIMVDPHGKVPANVQRMYEYAWLAKELDLMQGDTNGEFLPYNNVSRAEVITVIDRALTK